METQGKDYGQALQDAAATLTPRQQEALLEVVHWATRAMLEGREPDLAETTAAARKARATLSQEDCEAVARAIREAHSGT